MTNTKYIRYHDISKSKGPVQHIIKLFNMKLLLKDVFGSSKKNTQRNINDLSLIIKSKHKLTKKRIIAIKFLIIIIHIWFIFTAYDLYNKILSKKIN